MGKSLKEFELCVGHDLQSVPQIFHLLVGYFQHNPETLKTVGLFRIAAKDQDVQRLETHLSMGNYHRLTHIKNPHVVSNYWKIMMREMSEPICPFDHYPKFMELTPIPADQRLEPLKDRI
jgi:hypothetical protein